MRQLVKRFISKTTKISVILMLLATLFVLEPALRGKVSFALTLLNAPKVSSEEVSGKYLIPIVAEPVNSEPGHAPEPSTFILLFGGLMGIIVRYVRRGFDKIKRFMDVVLSIIGLGITSPILMFAAILIKLDSPGPIVYRQTRLGKNGKIFNILKLRSMMQDAEKNTGAVWAKKNDSRVTAVGRMLRNSRIDEIPQLINVLRGEMSIVGPRPERPEIVRDFKNLIHDYDKRLLVKPGITGLAQVALNYDETIEDVKKKVKCDLLYIRKKCLLTDLSILTRTFGVVLTGKGAI